MVRIDSVVYAAATRPPRGKPLDGAAQSRWRRGRGPLAKGYVWQGGCGARGEGTLHSAQQEDWMERTSTSFTRWVGFANVLNLVLFPVLFTVGDASARLLTHQPAGQRPGRRPSGEWTDVGVIVLALLKIALAIA